MEQTFALLDDPSIQLLRHSRILVTGATGFIGGRTCKALLQAGVEVHGLSNIRVDGTSGPVRHWEVDLCDLSGVRKAIAAIRPEIVIHLAGLVDTRQELSLVLPTLSNNLVATVNLLTVLSEAGCKRVIVAGSSEEPDVSLPGGPPNSPYAAANEAVTAYARLFHRIFKLPVVIVRPFMGYGPGQSPIKVIPYAITSFMKNVPPRINSGERICDLIYIDDLVSSLLLAAVRDEVVGEIVDLGTGAGTAIREAVNIIHDFLDAPCAPVFSPQPSRLDEYPQVADIQKTTQQLGFRPRWSLRDGLSKTIEWYRVNGEQR